MYIYIQTFMRREAFPFSIARFVTLRCGDAQLHQLLKCLLPPIYINIYIFLYILMFPWVACIQSLSEQGGGSKGVSFYQAKSLNYTQVVGPPQHR